MISAMLMMFVAGALSVGAVSIWARTRTASSVVMTLGVALFWLGLVLGELSPRKVIVPPQPAMEASEPGVMTRQVALALNNRVIDFLPLVGVVLFAGGFLAHGIGARRGS